MEAATVDQKPEEQPNLVPRDVKLFKYSAWVHVGPGANACDEVNEEDGEVACSNRSHFHAWVRLPNELQIQDIREKASAAKARRVRQLRDGQTDAYEILEEELDQLARLGDSARKDIIEELLQKDWWKVYGEAAKDVMEKEISERDDAEPHKPYEHIERDQDRFAELERMPPADRPQDEWDELDRHLGAYNDEVEARTKLLEQPRRDELEALDINALIDLVREDRITAEGGGAFLLCYTQEEWLLCTLDKPAGAAVFTSVEHLKSQSQEVLIALKETFDDLEKQERGLRGNS